MSQRTQRRVSGIRLVSAFQFCYKTRVPLVEKAESYQRSSLCLSFPPPLFF